MTDINQTLFAVCSGVAWALALGAVIVRGRHSWWLSWLLTGVACVLLIEAQAGAVQWAALAVTVSVEGWYIRRILDRAAVAAPGAVPAGVA